MDIQDNNNNISDCQIPSNALQAYNDAQHFIKGDMYPMWEKGASLLAKAALLGYPGAASEYILFSIKRRIQAETIIEYYTDFVARGISIDQTAQEKYDEFYTRHQRRLDARKQREEDIKRKEIERQKKLQEQYELKRSKRDALILHELLNVEKVGYHWYFAKIEEETTIPRNRIEQALKILQNQNNIKFNYIDNDSFKLSYLQRYVGKYNRKNNDLLPIWKHKWLLWLLMIVVFVYLFSRLWEVGFWTIAITAILLAFVTLFFPSPDEHISEIEKRFGFCFERYIHVKEKRFHEESRKYSYSTTSYIMPRWMFRKFIAKCKMSGKVTVSSRKNESVFIDKYDCTINFRWDEHSD